jgi:lipoprotein NlpD
MVGLRLGLCGAVCSICALLSACSSTSLTRAPVEDRARQSPPASVTGDARTQSVKQPPGFENAGKPGYYTVKPGDTMIRIGLENGQSPKDIASWSGIENPNKIEVGQVLRVTPPHKTDAATVKPVASSSSTTTALPPASAASAPAKSSTPPANAASSTGSPASGGVGDESVAWMWPSNGTVLAGFDESKNNKGLDIGGNAGDPVYAAAEGKVVYAGSGLRGYGNLVILKHNNTYLTAYAHNQTLLVKEDQTVKKGQKIAEMGNSDADRVKLHFEVRKQGKPVDPSKFLPQR